MSIAKIMYAIDILEREGDMVDSIAEFTISGKLLSRVNSIFNFSPKMVRKANKEFIKQFKIKHSYSHAVYVELPRTNHFEMITFVR